MSKRKDWPEDVQKEVLLMSKRRCCLCFSLDDDKSEKRGQIAHIDRDHANYRLSNAAYLCLDHHEEYDSRSCQAKGFTPAELTDSRNALYREIAENGVGPRMIIPFPPAIQTTNGNNNTVINASGDVNYNVRGRRKEPTINPPPTAIGSSSEMRSYIEYLVGRYIEWRRNGISRGMDQRPFFPGIMNTLIKKKFGGRASLLPQARFDEVVGFVQNAIDNTIWGRNSPNRNYHSFEEHLQRA